MTGSFDAFLDQQAQVYAKFRRALAEEVPVQGLQPDVNISECRGGYLIALRYAAPGPAHIAGSAARIAHFLPHGIVVPYDADLLHTTISDFGFRPDFVIPHEGHGHVSDPPQPEDQSLVRLTAGVRRAVESLRLAPWGVRYDEVLANRTTVIAAGHPDGGFFDLACTIVAECRREGIELRMPWGAHMTIARVTAVVTADALRSFGGPEIFRSSGFTPIELIPESVTVGMIAFAPDRIRHATYAQFPLR